MENENTIWNMGMGVTGHFHTALHPQGHDVKGWTFIIRTWESTGASICGGNSLHSTTCLQEFQPFRHKSISEVQNWCWARRAALDSACQAC